VKDKIDGAAAANVQKRANKRRMLLQKVNSIVRDGLLVVPGSEHRGRSPLFPLSQEAES